MTKNETFCDLCDRYKDNNLQCMTNGLKDRGGGIVSSNFFLKLSVQTGTIGFCKLEINLQYFKDLKPGVNFTNILQAYFLEQLFCKTFL